MLLLMALLVLFVLLHALTLALNLAFLALRGAKARRGRRRGRISVKRSRHHGVGFHRDFAGTGARAAFPGPTSKAGAGAFLASGVSFLHRIARSAPPAPRSPDRLTALRRCIRQRGICRGQKGDSYFPLIDIEVEVRLLRKDATTPNTSHVDVPHVDVA